MSLSQTYPSAIAFLIPLLTILLSALDLLYKAATDR